MYGPFRSLRQTGKSSLREVLADSHVAAVAIAFLLLWSLDAAFHAIWDPVLYLGFFRLTGTAIQDISYFMLITSFYFLYSAIVSLLTAWLLSRWVYGKGPLHSLAACRGKLTVRK
jgi:hypothetical protein